MHFVPQDFKIRSNVKQKHQRKCKETMTETNCGFNLLKLTRIISTGNFVMAVHFHYMKLVHRLLPGQLRQ